MSLPRFFLENQVVEAETDEVFPLRLTKDDAKHAKVLRLQPGEHIAVIDAAKDYFECEIVEFNDSIPLVRISQHIDTLKTGPSVLLIQGVAKADKLEMVIRHATEVGVDGFIPLSCERSVVKLDSKKAQSKLERWQAIAKSAAMQAGRNIIPEVTLPMSLTEACEAVKNATTVLICWEEAPESASMREALQNALTILNLPAQDARVAIVVGPEGGLTEREVSTFLSCNPRARLVTLGSSILRTETAGIVAPALVLHELGGMGNSKGVLS